MNLQKMWRAVMVVIDGPQTVRNREAMAEAEKRCLAEQDRTHVHGAWCHPSADGCPDDLR